MATSGNAEKAVNLPAPKDLSHHVSQLSRRRQPSAIKRLYPYMKPGAYNLAGGMPAAALFPFDTLEASVAVPTRFSPASQATSWTPWATNKPDSQRLTVPKWPLKGASPAERLDLASSLQYGTAVNRSLGCIGITEVYAIGGITCAGCVAQGLVDATLHLATVNEVKKLSKAIHGIIPYDSPEIVMSCGSTDGISKAMQLLLDPNDHLLVEEFAFRTALEASRPWGVSAAPVKMDDMGMLPDGLRHVLENWDHTKGKRPHVLYSVTQGQNPTGGVLSLERKKEIYQLCQEFDIVIVEDDPYFYLQYDRPIQHSEKSPDGTSPFFRALSPSYLQIDTDGRVIRLDTFSKTVAPGCRCGWITAQPLFIERMTRQCEVSTQQPSGFVQSMLASLLKTWKLDGWTTWLEGLRDQYENRRNIMCAALVQGFETEGGPLLIKEVEGFHQDHFLHLSTPELCTFVKPAGGMFVWLRVHIDLHPLYKTVGKRELMDKLWVHLAENKVVISPGWVFSTNDEVARNQDFFRFCFAAIPEEDIKYACLEFGRMVKAFFLQGSA